MYTPPAGNAVAFDFTASYTPPAGNAVVLDFGAETSDAGAGSYFGRAFFAGSFYGPRYFGGGSGALAPPVVAEPPSGGWFRKPKPRFPGETDSERDARIRMGILPPDDAPDSQPDAPGLSTTLSEDLAGLEALAARAAQLTIDEEIAMWLRLDQQRRLHEAWLRDEDDAAVLMLAIATLH